MKELVVISGKGGTGKTSIVAALASLAAGKALCDADVDAADLHLILNPTILEHHDFQSGNSAVIDPKRCTQCGLCRDLCRWEAIGEAFEVNELDCEGCGVCVHFCPEKAIDFPVKTCGEWYASETRFGPMIHARLGIAEENSGKLVSLVRREAKRIAEENQADFILTDGPPGVGCPVIAAVGGSSAVLVVTEPTVSGIHDMQRVVELADHFKVPTMVCVNKSDLNQDAADQIAQFAEARNIPFLGTIPFDPAATKSMVQGQTIFEYDERSSMAQAVIALWKRILAQMELEPISKIV